MTRLKDGLGFVSTNLDHFQKVAVALILRHENPLTPFSLCGASGTGKTYVLDEVVLQVVQYHTENYPNEAS